MSNFSTLTLSCKCVYTLTVKLLTHSQTYICIDVLKVCVDVLKYTETLVINKDTCFIYGRVSA